ncbi:polysaccharide biosynthesis/export family protein [Roseovarius tibetensis]|uniref:polysaccharide biosynthesis/export family protein n=1 Tax=Roseovarius tibetensis TaxID=2685897 RepID=UPI003D7F92BD
MIRFLAALFVMAGLAGTATAQSSYSIQPGDTLQIEVLEDPELGRNVLVLPDGSISFPLAGTLQAGGRTVDGVANTITQRLAGDFAIEPTVLVSVASLAPEGEERDTAVDLMKVYIIGEANQPGLREVETGTTLLQFLAEAGGLSRFAARKRIQLRRIDPQTGQERVYRFNYNSMGGDNSISGTTVLAPGDVIVVPERRLFE